MTERILIVEDDRRMQKVLSHIFLREGFEVETADSGLVALRCFQENIPKAVLLDLMLPQLSGRDVCRQMKAVSPRTPVLIVSAIADVVDKVLLLEMGADDYVTKPFSPRELLARVQAAIRRQDRNDPPVQQETCHFGKCRVDFGQMLATCNGKVIILTALEFKLLRFFTANANIVFTRETLLEKVWGYNAFPTTRTVDNQILKLRQKLQQDPANPVHLHTIYGMGYKFVF